jgi:dephospho-CoA kinase
MNRGKPLLAGLTGGIGSGKSTVLRLLGEGGCETISADLLAREAVAPGSEGLAAVIARFGESVATPEGALDRRALGRLVFADPVARLALERIIHPLVFAGEDRAIALWKGRGCPAPLVVESPLLLEVGREGRYDLVVLVTCPMAARLARLAAAGIGPEDAEARMAAQWPEGRAVPLAGRTIDNGRDIDHLRRQVDSLLPLLRGETPSAF